ncbi:MAG: zinc ribbon domain-containing protein [Anaerolineae bacterium]|nr:zinc ribbon domain-containing protein [Anaerolineae bacterium]
MAIIIFGTKGRVVSDSSASTQTTTCRYCGNVVAMEPVRNKRYFTLFFIPIFPLEKGETAWRCPSCKKLFLRRE